MSSVALKTGVEEPWTLERVAQLFDLRGYREIKLKSGTDPAIIAFRIRVAEMCNVEVTTEDVAQRRHRIERVHREHSNADAQNHQNHQVSL